MKNLFFVIAILFLASCSHRIIQTTKTVEKDSVHVDTVKTQIVKKVKGDSVGMGFKLPSAIIILPEEVGTDLFGIAPEDPIVFQRTQKTGRLTETVTISKKGNVKFSCKEDSLKEIIESQRITIQKFKSVTTTTTKAEVCPPKTKWATFCEWWTWLCIGGIIGFLVFKFRALIKIPFL
jgi:hypothetical protein